MNVIKMFWMMLVSLRNYPMGKDEEARKPFGIGIGNRPPMLDTLVKLCGMPGIPSNITLLDSTSFSMCGCGGNLSSIARILVTLTPLARMAISSTTINGLSLVTSLSPMVAWTR